MEIEHVRLKAFAVSPASAAGLDADVAIRVFHSWIQERACEELLIDVADYSHVVDGPIVLLIAHEAELGFDASGGRLGFYYRRKKPVAGGAAARLDQAWKSLAAALDRLERDARFGGKLAFDRARLEIAIADRALAPNTAETFAALRGELVAFARRVFGADATLTHTSAGEPRDLLRVLAARA